jgi:hypothetical protein
MQNYNSTPVWGRIAVYLFPKTGSIERRVRMRSLLFVAITIIGIVAAVAVLMVLVSGTPLRR